MQMNHRHQPPYHQQHHQFVHHHHPAPIHNNLPPSQPVIPHFDLSQMPQIPVIPTSHIPPPLTTNNVNNNNNNIYQPQPQSPLLSQSTTNNALPYNPHCIPQHAHPPKPPSPQNTVNSPPKSPNKNTQKRQKRLISETKVCFCNTTNCN